jgi:hypothetical protein
VERTLAAGLGLGAVNALLALLAVHVFRQSGLGWFGSPSTMPRRYADYLPGSTTHTSVALVVVLVAAFLVANTVAVGFGYRLTRRQS